MEIIRSIFIAGLPTAQVGYALIYWSIKKDYISADDSIAKLKQKKKESDDSDSDFKLNPIHQKWLFFGGGYYGTMAFATYLHVEAIEIFDFFAAYTSWDNLMELLSFASLIGLVIESFLNIVPAFLWFQYWPGLIEIKIGWYWLAASYAGYQIGAYAAKYISKNNAIGYL